MDVCRLGYADAAFDAVVAQFLITLVPDPEAALSEFLRVVRPGGEIVLANHFGQAEGPVARVEEIVAPLCTKIGWSSDFKSTRIEAWARTHGVEFIGVAPTFPGGFFKILRMRKRA
jgi:phosphatidylethanolamine/phosphatidyl-N-methylethanolamine N-methyltransferase